MRVALSLPVRFRQHPPTPSQLLTPRSHPQGSEEAYRTTVTSPATSKNAIAVGATLSPASAAMGEKTSAQVMSGLHNALHGTLYAHRAAEHELAPCVIAFQSIDYQCTAPLSKHYSDSAPPCTHM